MGLREHHHHWTFQNSRHLREIAAFFRASCDLRHWHLLIVSLPLAMMKLVYRLLGEQASCSACCAAHSEERGLSSMFCIFKNFTCFIGYIHLTEGSRSSSSSRSHARCQLRAQLTLFDELFDIRLKGQGYLIKRVWIRIVM